MAEENITVQIMPVCFGCCHVMDADLPVYYAPTVCEHPGCPSACWHLPCLVRHRERMAEIETEIEQAQHHHQTPSRRLKFRKYSDG